MTSTTIQRRGMLKLAGMACLAALLPAAGRAGQPVLGIVQQVQHARLYMTHYALFEEPDPGIQPGIYIDAATGMPANEMTLTQPLETFGFLPSGQDPADYVMAASGPVKLLPYGVSPPGFPPLSAPDSAVAAIAGVLGGSVPYNVIKDNTSLFLVAIGHFEPTTGVIDAKRVGTSFSVTRDTEFQVRVRVGFLFQPPAGLQAPRVGIVTWLTRGLVDLLIGVLPDPGTENDIVVYDWRATMTLSTENSYVREVASQPPPVADGLPAGLDAIRFIGSPVDSSGRYTIVGHAEHVPFAAPPELVQFLFGTTVLTDVEFAVEESGVLTYSADGVACAQPAVAGVPGCNINPQELLAR